MNMKSDEIVRQESIEWERSKSSQWYKILGKFQVQSVVEVGKPSSLLDLACGDGILTAQFSKYFTRIVGVDASSTHIAKAKKVFPEGNFYVSMIEDFKINEKFDTVIMLCILEHVIDPIQSLRIAANFLKPSGRLIVQVPNALAVNRRIGKIMGVIEDEYQLSKWDIEIAGHRRYYDMKRLVNEFLEAGLKVLTTGGIFYKLFSTPQMEWFLNTGLWDSNEFGWGGINKSKDWRWEFCKACNEIGKEWPNDCNVIYACGTNNF